MRTQSIALVLLLAGCAEQYDPGKACTMPLDDEPGVAVVWDDLEVVVPMTVAPVAGQIIHDDGELVLVTPYDADSGWQVRVVDWYMFGADERFEGRAAPCEVR